MGLEKGKKTARGCPSAPSGANQFKKKTLLNPRQLGHKCPASEIKHSEQFNPLVTNLGCFLQEAAGQQASSSTNAKLPEKNSFKNLACFLDEH